MSDKMSAQMKLYLEADEIQYEKLNSIKCSMMHGFTKNIIDNSQKTMILSFINDKKVKHKNL